MENVYHKKKMKENDLVNLNNVKKFTGYKKDYARSKIIMEREFIKIGKRNFNVSIARLFSFIGKKILINKNFAVTDLIHQAKDIRTNKIRIDDNRNIFRGYMNSSDLVKWLITILTNSSNKCDIYNVGSDEAIKIKDLANMFAKKFRKTVAIKNKINFSKTIDSVDYYVPSVLKAKKKLKLKLKFNIYQSIDELLRN
jgi:nucleoside-diphosphate-sugar epimerase